MNIVLSLASRWREKLRGGGDESWEWKRKTRLKGKKTKYFENCQVETKKKKKSIFSRFSKFLMKIALLPKMKPSHDIPPSCHSVFPLEKNVCVEFRKNNVMPKHYAQGSGGYRGSWATAVPRGELTSTAGTWLARSVVLESRRHPHWGTVCSNYSYNSGVQ